MMGFVQEFENEPTLTLFSCAYCNNYSRTDGKGLHDPVFKTLIDEFPLFTKEDTKLLGNRLKNLLENGSGF
jgi:hypothetical protein